jgi:hypothetical protein
MRPQPPCPTIRLSNHDDCFELPDGTKFPIGDFWRWAFANLCDDGLKGVFAEWMVGKLLGLDLGHGARRPGDNTDLPYRGRHIEVKSTSYWQSYKLWKSGVHTKPTEKPRFAGLWSHWTEGADNSARAPGFKSDVYVFCFQKQKDEPNWDALNLSNWDFYVRSQSQLMDLKAARDKKNRNGKAYSSYSIGLHELDNPIAAHDLKNAVDKIVDQLETAV